MSDPAEKYRDQVDPRHRMAMEAISLAHMVLENHAAHFKAFEDSRRHMDSIGCLLNPMLYRDMIHSRSFEQQEKLIGAAREFLRATDEVYAQVREEAA